MKAVYPVMAAKGLMEPIDWDANLKAFYLTLQEVQHLKLLRLC